jgi:peptidoglycan/xylan/chitin deacetylase (PgdA/CDA1 family)
MEKEDPYWQRAEQEVYRSPEEIVAQDKEERRSGEVLPKLIRGNKKEKLLALTFDDGPHPLYTERLLALLREEHVPATFFVIGKMVRKYPELVRDISMDGNLVGNHTYSHVTLTNLSFDEMMTEYQADNDIIERTIGKPVHFCRPPGGDYNRDVIRAASETGMTTVLWTDDPGDYANPGTNVIEKRLLKKISNGGIILLHDGIEQTMEVLPQLIQYARDKGYKFVTVDQLKDSLTPAPKISMDTVAKKGHRSRDGAIVRT